MSNLWLTCQLLRAIHSGLWYPDRQHQAVHRSHQAVAPKSSHQGFELPWHHENIMLGTNSITNSLCALSRQKVFPWQIWKIIWKLKIWHLLPPERSFPPVCDVHISPNFFITPCGPTPYGCPLSWRHWGTAPALSPANSIGDFLEGNTNGHPTRPGKPVSGGTKPRQKNNQAMLDHAILWLKYALVLEECFNLS